MDPDRGPVVDQSSLMEDGVLEVELRQALKSEGDIELFKAVQLSFQIANELANTASVKIMLSAMWSNVADFFERITEVPTLAGLAHDDPVVIDHQRMLANFEVVASINAIFKAAAEAETELRAADDMGQEIEETPP